MEQEAFFTKCEELLKDHLETALDKVKIIANSGAIDVDAAEDDFILPKTVVTAILESTARAWEPYNEPDRIFNKNVKNIRRFI